MYSHPVTKEIPTKKDVYKYIYFPRTVTDWNSLPPDITSAPRTVSFRARLAKA